MESLMWRFGIPGVIKTARVLAILAASPALWRELGLAARVT
jgi:hypothetical protein